jgi:hypothetical protein
MIPAGGILHNCRRNNFSIALPPALRVRHSPSRTAVWTGRTAVIKSSLLYVRMVGTARDRIALPSYAVNLSQLQPTAIIVDPSS